MSYIGIALGGRKGNGKSLIAEHLCTMKIGAIIVPSKTPIVEAFEAHYRVTYVKARDDQALIKFSTEIARAKNPKIVAEWLESRIPVYYAAGFLPVVPDMRFHDENIALRRARMLCIKIDASEETRRARTASRDGSLANYDPLSPTEREIDTLKYDFVIDNNLEDGGASAIRQLEMILRTEGIGPAPAASIV